MSQKPLEIRITRQVNRMWLNSRRWVNDSNIEYILGPGGLQGNYRVIANGRFLCHLIRSALPSHVRQELFGLLIKVARNKVTDTKRLKNVGGGVRGLKLDGTPSAYARARNLSCLQDAREGFFGFQGVGQGNGCGPCAFNRENPEAYRQLVPLCEAISDLAREHEPGMWQKQMNDLFAHRDKTIGTTPWPQGVANWLFPMTVHQDKKNVEGSLSASTVFGDFDGGAIIFPAFSLGIFLQPGDLLLFDGHAHHGLGPFTGVRMSLVLYLNRGILHCPGLNEEAAATATEPAQIREELDRAAVATASESSPALPAESVPLPPPIAEPKLAVAGFEHTVDRDDGKLDDSEPHGSSEQPDDSMSEHFARAIKFGRELITTQDLDPVYTAIHGAELDYEFRARLLLTYSCIYHLGASITIAQRQGADYWDALMVAAVNEGLKWPRGSERRHWRGKQALTSVNYLRDKYKKPEDVVEHWAAGGPNSFVDVTNRVKEVPIFGPWIGFKVADMLERCLGRPVDFSTCAMGVYKEPRAAAALILTGNHKTTITDSDLESVMKKMMLPEHLGALMAPPDFARPVNVQEIETCLCKFKSHIGGHYAPGKDTQEVLEGLVKPEWNNAVTRRMVQVLETLPYAQKSPTLLHGNTVRKTTTSQMAGKRKPPSSETADGITDYKQGPNH